jgi:hypothetical protein
VNLYLSQLPQLRGPSHGTEGRTYRGLVPPRALYLAPDAARALLDLEAASGGLRYTDVFRSAKTSLAACQAKPDQAKPPGFSPHGFGLAVDLDLSETLATKQWTYAQLLVVMGRYGWFCHRRDASSSGSEAWHFNYLGPNPALYLAMASKYDHRSWARPVEERILERYAKHWLVRDSRQLQQMLAQLGHYQGAIDSQVGPETQAAIAKFQTRWCITNEPSIGGARTYRTLVYVTATVVLVPPAQAWPVGES